jgi:hypothetical protein
MGGESRPSESKQKPRNLFRTKKPRKPKPKPEWKLQAAVVSDFHKCQDMGWDFEFAGDMNAGKRNGARAKLTGLKAGEADIRIYLPGAKLGMIEMKNEKGELSDDQIKRHGKLEALGFKIHVVQASTEVEAASKCRKILTGMIRGTLH